MWKKSFIASAMVLSTLLTGCISPDSANVYKKNEMKSFARARSGMIEQVRDVQMKDSTGLGGIAGGAIGGIAAGSNIGQGSGSAVAAILGAIIGGLIGNQIESNITQKNAKELTIRMSDNGERLVIVQDADMNFQAGQNVDVITDGNSARVVPFHSGSHGDPHKKMGTAEKL